MARGYKKISFGILVCIYCHNIPTCTPQSGYHGVTEVAKNTAIATMPGNCIYCFSTRPILPTQTLWIRDLKTLVHFKIEKNQSIHYFQPKHGGHFFNIFLFLMVQSAFTLHQFQCSKPYAIYSF